MSELAYDFTPLDGPMPADEARARRRALRQGRSVLRELSLMRGLALMFMGFVWLWVVPIVFVLGFSIVGWFVQNGPTPDFVVGAPLLVVGALAVVALCVVLTRWCVLPPRWGRWVRMHRFAEHNDLEFVRFSRPEPGVRGLAENTAGLDLMSDAFVDPLAGVVLGNAGVGAGTQAFVLLTDAPGGRGVSDDEPLAAGEQPLDGFTVSRTARGLLAVRFTRARMRDSDTIRRMFATADALRRGDHAAIR